MSTPPSLTAEGILLNRQMTSENFLHLVILSPEAGIFHAGKRVSTSGGGKTPAPDLFDEVALTLEPPRHGTTPLRFIREYRLLRRHEQLGSNYRTLSLACRFARIVSENPLPETSAGDVYATLRQALEAWEAGRPAEVVYFKALFRFAREEGLPVAEDWVNRLPGRDRETVKNVLHRPANDVAASPARIERLVGLFEKYLSAEQELRLP